MNRPRLGAMRFEAGQKVVFNVLQPALSIVAKRTRPDGSLRRWAAISGRVDNKIELRFGGSGVSIVEGTQVMAGFNRYPVVVKVPTEATHVACVCATAPATLVIGWLDWQ